MTHRTSPRNPPDRSPRSRYNKSPKLINYCIKRWALVVRKQPVRFTSMKTSFATLVALLAISATSEAAPRLVVSTPSLAPESEIDLVLDRPVTAPADLGKTVDNTW